MEIAKSSQFKSVQVKSQAKQSVIMTAATKAQRKPIAQRDVVAAKGRYLFVGRKRFFMKGIAFPTPPPPTQAISVEDPPDLSGWNAVLDQLAEETDVNVIRVYEMDCRRDYGAFLERAAELGIYVIVPLTSRSGDGVLSRDAVPPRCYPRKLYRYGIDCIDAYWDRPNVIAGVVGNEVMNNRLTWRSAPCVKAYLNDLAAYMQTRSASGGQDDEEDSSSSTTRTSLPLLYATQHDSPSAELHADEAMKLTMDYLSCNDGASVRTSNDFIFGINIESWCSSLQSFRYEEDGVSESSYHSLWSILSGHGRTKTVVDPITGEKTVVEVPPVSTLNVTAPIVFSEMGCAKNKFNRDNDVQPKLVRDWKQIPLVIEGGRMSAVFSGFVSYGYDGGGNPYFRMMGGAEKWDGKHTLPSGPDYDNFRHQLSKAIQDASGYDAMYDLADVDQSQLPPSSCDDTVEILRNAWRLDLYPLAKMPSYFGGRAHSILASISSIRGGLGMQGGSSASGMIIFGLFVLLITAAVAVFVRRRRRAYKLKSYNESADESGLLMADEKRSYS